VCVRYNTIDERWERFIRRLGVWKAIELPPKQYEMFPRHIGQIIRLSEHGGLELAEAKFGIIPPFPDASLFQRKPVVNARAEGGENRPIGIENMTTFRDPFRYRRCLVPMTSYFEYGDRTPTGKAIIEIVPRGSEEFLVPGLWEPPNRHSETPTFVLVTTASNATLAPVHSRNLAMVEEENMPLWFDHTAPMEAVKSLLAPPPDDWMEVLPGRAPERKEQLRRETSEKKPKPAEPSLFD